MDDQTFQTVNFFTSPVFLLATGAIIGFLLGLLKDYINYKMQKEQKEKDLALNRLDEIFILLNKHSDNTLKTLSNMFKNNSNKKEFDKTVARLSFLIRVYFPDMHDVYKDYLLESIKFGNYQLSLGVSVDIKQATSIIASEEYQSKALIFNKKISEICTLIIKEANNYKF